MTPLVRPEIFGDFLLLARLASRGAVEVLVGVRLGDRSGRTFVLKRPRLGERPSAQAARSVAREAEVLEDVRDPSIVRLEAAGTLAGLPYVALEHVDGASVDAMFAAGPLPPEALVAVARDLARALAAVHAAGWTHGDVSPANVLVDDAGDVYLADFGLAERVGAHRPEGAGTPGFAAPEAVLPGEAAPPADVFGWGAVILGAALGRRPFEESQLAEAAARVAELPALPADLGPLASLVADALARDPAARPSADAIVRALEEREQRRTTLAERALAARTSATDLVSATPVRAASAPLPRRPSAAPDAKPRAASSRSARWVAVLAAFAAFVGGATLGRLSDRASRPTIGLLGAVPRRMELAIDERPILGAGDEPVRVEAGRHAVTITFARSTKTYDIDVRRGDRVLLVPVGKPPPDEERAP